MAVLGLTINFSLTPPSSATCLVCMITGCLIAELDASVFACDDENDDMMEEDWEPIWKDSFKSLTRLNIRNVTQNSGNPPDTVADILG